MEEENIPNPEFFNRELSWMDFNARVLDEALQEDIPILERIKFLAIVSSNFDEFFMVRVASLRRMIKAGDRSYSPSPLLPSETLKEVHKRYRTATVVQHKLLEELFFELKKHHISYLKPSEFSQEQLAFCRDLFHKELFNVLAPVKVEEKRPFPFTGNLKLILAFLIRPGAGVPVEIGSDPLDPYKLVVVEIPSYLPRIVWIPDQDGRASYTLIEDVVQIFAEQLFHGYLISQCRTFRITRDADIPVDEEKEEDFVEAMSKILQNRMHSSPTRLEIGAGSPELKERLSRALEIDPQAVFEIPGPLNLKDFMSLVSLHGFESLKYPVWEAHRPIPDDENIWDLIKESDLLLFHPYESFAPVIRLLSEAAVDPNVLSIRMTLYRTSGDSPIVQALAKAAREGKQVTVLVELKARFDEEQNIEWAQTLEKAGGIVIYGVANLKVHAKALMIARREPEGIRRYVHLGTGNYHDKTARLYTDLGLFSAKDEFTREVAQFFNAITGYSAVSKMRSLVTAPHFLKKKLLDLISGLTKQAGMGISCRIMAKMNSLADEDVIRALYAASRAGVEILLNIRGICMLVPGKEFSKNITVVSIVDRFLEHIRIFAFRSGDQEEVFLSSADWMFRNLERRVELMFPILQKDLRERVTGILKVFFQDTAKSHKLGSDGIYRRLKDSRKPPFRAQEYFHERAKALIQFKEKTINPDFVVLKKPGKE